MNGSLEKRDLDRKGEDVCLHLARGERGWWHDDNACVTWVVAGRTMKPDPAARTRPL